MTVTEADRATDLRLARLQLRLGALGLARAALEMADAEAALTGGSLVDFAEVCWRTGDLMGAGEAAEKSLAEGGETPLALAIATEAGMAAGHPALAKSWMLRALEVVGDGPARLDALFVGMPRSAIWPAAVPEDANRADADGLPERADEFASGVSGMILAAVPTAVRPASALRGSDPVAELQAARADLLAGDASLAAIRLAVLLRATPALAPAVLDLIHGTQDPSLEVVRGDAYRLVGREVEAARAFAQAAAAINAHARRPSGTTVHFGANVDDVPADQSDRRFSQEEPS